MANGGVNKARYDSVYISPETLLNRRDISRKIFPRYRDQAIFHILWHSGRKKRTVQTKFNHFEKGFLKEVGIITGTSTGGTATNPVVVTLNASSHTESGTLSPGQKRQMVMMGNMRGWIQDKDTTTPNAHTLTIKPVNETDTLISEAAAGKIITFLSTAYADGTGFDDSHLRKPDTVYNYTQIFKNTFRADGSEAANEQEATVGGTNFYWNDLVVDTSNTHMMEKEFAYLFGERSEYVADADNASKKVYMTGGLDYFTENFGLKHQYTTFALADAQTIIKKLNKERAPKNQMGLFGIDLQLDFDAAIRALNKSDTSGGAIDFSAHGKAKGKFKAADFGFVNWSVGDYTFHYKSYDALDYKPVTGYDIGGETAEWPTVGYLIPLATVQNQDKESEDDRMIPTIRLRYKSNGGVTRQEGVKHFKRDIKVHGIDMCEWDWISEDGLQFAGVNQFLKIHK